MLLLGIDFLKGKKAVIFLNEADKSFFTLPRHGGDLDHVVPVTTVSSGGEKPMVLTVTAAPTAAPMVLTVSTAGIKAKNGAASNGRGRRPSAVATVRPKPNVASLASGAPLPLP